MVVSLEQVQAFICHRELEETFWSRSNSIKCTSVKAEHFLPKLLPKWQQQIKINRPLNLKDHQDINITQKAKL
mgnify:CR=1 FL=1